MIPHILSWGSYFLACIPPPPRPPSSSSHSLPPKYHSFNISCAHITHTHITQPNITHAKITHSTSLTQYHSTHLAHSRWTTFLKKLSGGRSSCYWQKASLPVRMNLKVPLYLKWDLARQNFLGILKTAQPGRPADFFFVEFEKALRLRAGTPEKSSDHIRHLSPQRWGLHAQFSLHSKLVSENVAGFHITLEGGCKTEVRNSKQLFTLSWPSNFHKVPLVTFFARAKWHMLQSIERPFVEIQKHCHPSLFLRSPHFNAHTG